MSGATQFLLLSLCFNVFPWARALPWDGPEPTQSHSLDSSGWTPKPTDAAILRQNRMLDLPLANILQRQIGVSTCGYMDRDSRVPRICNPGSICVSNPINNVMGCCTEELHKLTECQIATSCMPSSALSFLCTDTACEQNPFIAHCTKSAFDKCKTLYYDFGSDTRSELLCDSTTGQFTYYPSYKGEQSFTGFEISRVNRVTKNTIGHYRFYTPPPSSSSTNSISETFSPTPKPSSASSGTNIGAIVGGVVGALVIIVGVTVCLCIRQRKHNRHNEPRKSNDAVTMSELYVPPSYQYQEKPVEADSIPVSAIQDKKPVHEIFSETDVKGVAARAGVDQRGVYEICPKG